MYEKAFSLYTGEITQPARREADGASEIVVMDCTAAGRGGVHLA